MNAMIDKIAWIYMEQERILSVRSRDKDTYYLPGGKRDPGESDIEALMREVNEELSVHIKQESISYFGTFEAAAHGKAEGVVVRMTCYIADYEGELSPASEIEELAWLSYQDRDQLSIASQLIFDRLHEMKLLK